VKGKCKSGELHLPAAARKWTFLSFVVAAQPPQRTKKMVLSLLPQAKKPLVRPAPMPAPTA
jgi:hypothetical protein